MADLTFSGQTDEVLTVELPSNILYAKWRGNATSAGGVISIEVMTQWVANNSNITISITDRDGGAIETIEGKVWNNLFRKEYVPEPNDTQGLMFEAELPDHSLTAESNVMRVFPTVEITNHKFLNAEDESELEFITEGLDVILDAEVIGPPDGTPCIVTLYEKYSEYETRLIFSQEFKSEAGHVTAKWTQGLSKKIGEIDTYTELDRDAEEYFQPSYYFSVEAYGVKVTSDSLNLGHEMKLEYIESEGVAGRYEGRIIKVISPDGSEEDMSVPSDGIVIIEQSKPGAYKIDEADIEAADKEAQEQD